MKHEESCFVKRTEQWKTCILPPMQDALQQHSKPISVSYQAGIWTTSDQPQQEAPSPQEYGRTLNKENLSWMPVWYTLPPSSACSLQ